MGLAAIVAQLPVVSISNEAYKMQKAIKSLGHEAQVYGIGRLFMPNPRFTIPLTWSRFNLLIYWSAFVQNAVDTFRLYDNPYIAEKTVFYTVCEGKPLIRPDQAEYLKSRNVVFPSRFAAEMAREFCGINAAEIIPHGIDYNELMVDPKMVKAWRRKYEGRKIILYAGNAIIRKGIPKLIEAAKILRDTLKEKFVIVLHSRGERYDYLGYSLYQMLEQVKDVVVLEEEFGFVPKQRVLEKIAGCDIYVHPAHSEGFGIPVLEAMAFAKPVVYVDAPAVNEFAYGFKVKTDRVYWWRYANLMEFKMHDYSPAELAEVLRYVVEHPREAAEAGAKAAWRSREYEYTRTYGRWLKWMSG